MTPTSLIPDEAACIGISYEALVDRLLHYALERASDVQVG
jgi:D-alanine-D-alanine ligase-like ATP-grasp enzyme